jgi:hypothetical protein
VREEDTGEREAGAHSTTPTYTVRRDGPAREPSWSAFWLQKPSILRACVREEDAGGGRGRAFYYTYIYSPVNAMADYIAPMSSMKVSRTGEVCRRRSRAPAAESVRVRRREAVIARAGPETVTVSVGARGKRARNYLEAGSERACGAWAITSRDANP